MPSLRGESCGAAALWHACVCVTRERDEEGEKKMRQTPGAAAALSMSNVFKHTHTSGVFNSVYTRRPMPSLLTYASVLYLNSAAFTANLWSLKPADHHCCSGRTRSLGEKCTELFSAEMRGGRGG